MHVDSKVKILKAVKLELNIDWDMTKTFPKKVIGPSPVELLRNNSFV